MERHAQPNEHENPAIPVNESTGEALISTALTLPGARRGKVRDIYALPGDRLLIVATDRISAFDVVLPTPVPGKGQLLTAISAFWLRWIEQRGLARTHLISLEPGDIPEEAFGAGSTPRGALGGRATIGQACEVVPIECVARGYLEGSGWREYQQTGRVCGVSLPPGLSRCEKLPEPIFTPATKADDGEHDENITYEQSCAIAGGEVMRTLRDRTLAIYTHAAAYARDRGIIIADTKLEFGLPLRGDRTDPIVVDEALTPDSSRFWPAQGYEPGRPQPSFDKQFVREHLEDLVERGAWDKAEPGPELPGEVIAGTLRRYREAGEQLGAIATSTPR